MCYEIFLSTTSAQALDDPPSDLYRFVRITETDDNEITDLLEHPHRWYLECRYGGCSCHFRHLGEGSDMAFGRPEAWFPEDSDDIESTGAVYDVLARIVSSGHKMDIISTWHGARSASVRDLPVSLAQVSRDAFRLFENRRFILSP